ncbi:hypothetical protein [Pseudotenacibaculum haliotis]|uniref:DUF2335 domain-containing protein n=1 Tax=Pseudotenacibaculum haliotis TaxID=1862138 RepID=A0ABW5LRD0_9FLAO
MKNIYEQLKRKAYHEGLKFQNSTLGEEIIYAKLEKKGIPIGLAKEVAKNIVLERNKDKDEHATYLKKTGLIILCLWLLLSVVAYIYTGSFTFAFQLLGVIIPMAVLTHLMTTSK